MDCLLHHEEGGRGLPGKPMHAMRRWSSRTLIGVAAAALAACGGTAAPAGPKSSPPTSNAGASPSPLVIPAILSLSGQGAFLGNEEKEALTVLQTLTNQQGGVQGHPVQFHIVDDETSPKLAVQLAAGFHHVSAFLGPTLAGPCDAVAGALKPATVVDYCLSPVINPAPGSYVFSAIDSSTVEASTALKFAMEQGWTRVAFLATDDATGKTLLSESEKVLKQPSFKGLQLVGAAEYPVTAINANSEVSTVAAGHPQAVFVWTTGASLGAALKSINQSPLRSLPVFATGGNMTYKEMQAFAQFLPPHLYFATAGWNALPVLSAGPQKEAVSAFDQAFQTQVGHLPDLGNALAWDPAELLLTAYRHLGLDATASAIHQFLESQSNYVGIMGRYDFTSGNQRGLTPQDEYVYEWSPGQNTWLVVSGPGGSLRSTR